MSDSYVNEHHYGWFYLKNSRKIFYLEFKDTDCPFYIFKIHPLCDDINAEEVFKPERSRDDSTYCYLNCKTSATVSDTEFMVCKNGPDVALRDFRGSGEKLPFFFRLANFLLKPIF